MATTARDWKPIYIDPLSSIETLLVQPFRRFS